EAGDVAAVDPAERDIRRPAPAAVADPMGIEHALDEHRVGGVAVHVAASTLDLYMGGAGGKGRRQERKRRGNKVGFGREAHGYLGSVGDYERNGPLNSVTPK